MDGDVGKLLKALDDLKIADNTIVVFTTDNGPNMFSWPDAATTPFRSEKDSNWDGAFRVPAMIRWPGKIKTGEVANGIFSGLDWLPTLLAAAGDTTVKDRLLKGWKPEGSDTTFRNHLDGYNQLDYLTGKSDKSARTEFAYFDDDGDLVAYRHGRIGRPSLRSRRSRADASRSGMSRLRPTASLSSTIFVWIPTSGPTSSPTSTTTGESRTPI